MRRHWCQEHRLVLRQLTKLAAGSENVTALAFSNKYSESASPQHALELLDNGIIRTAESISGKFVKRNQIDLATDAIQQFYQPLGILSGIIHACEQNVFKGQPPVRCEGILAARGQESIKGVQPICRRHQSIALFIRRGVQRDS